MADHQAPGSSDRPIEQAYDRLATALAPPADTALRVERRLDRRRSLRRAGVAGALGVVAVGVVGAIVLLGSGDNGADTVAEDVPVSSTGSFVLTRPDGSTYEMSDLTLTCSPAEGSVDEGATARPQQILLISPRDFAADGEQLEQPFAMFLGIPDKIDGRTFQLPVDGSSSRRAFTLFAADPDVEPSMPEANEVSSAQDGAAGTVTVTRASCDGPPVLDLEIDATLGSEVDQGTLRLSGSYR